MVEVLRMDCCQDFLACCVIHVMYTRLGLGCVGNGTMYTWVCSGEDGRSVISTEVPVCAKTVWGGGWKQGEKEAWEKQLWLGMLLRSRTACSLKMVQSLPSKVRKTEEKISSLKEVIASSVPFSLFVGLVLVVCLLGLLVVTLDQSSRTKRRAGISGQCSPLPLGYKREVWLRR